MTPARFFFRAVVFASIVLVLLLICAWFGPHGSRVDYLGVEAAKQARLKSIPSPKVIIVGGSNATFGIDSELLEKELCRPVVNMSLHASLGARFMMDEVKNSLGKGDLVIVSLEHSGYSTPEKDNDIHILMVDRTPSTIQYIPWYSRPRVVMGVMLMRMQALYKVATGAWKNDSEDKVYRISGFNERGDIVSHMGLPQRDPERIEHVAYATPAVSDDFFPIAKDLLDHAEKSGAQVIWTWPVIANSSFRQGRNDTIAERLSEHNIHLLGNSSDLVLPDTAFYDTHYHLRAAGRQLRTRQLIKDLCGSGKVNCCGYPPK